MKEQALKEQSMSISLAELKERTHGLAKIAQERNIPAQAARRKQELIFQILRAQTRQTVV